MVQRRCPAGRFNPTLPRDVAEQLTQPWQLLTDAGTFVVLANDGPFVVKLFKNVEAVIAKFRSWGTDLGSARWTPFPGEERATATWMAGAVVDAATYAWDNLRTESALAYLHLAPSNEAEDLVVGHERLPVGQMPFLVQRRAEVLKDRLDRLMTDGRQDDACEVLDRWASFLLSLWARGIATHPNFDENYGYIGNQIVLLDVGDIRLGPGAIQHDIDRRLVLTHPAHGKLQAKHPSLAQYVTELAERRLFRFDPNTLDRQPETPTAFIAT